MTYKVKIIQQLSKLKVLEIALHFTLRPQGIKWNTDLFIMQIRRSSSHFVDNSGSILSEFPLRKRGDSCKDSGVPDLFFLVRFSSECVARSDLCTCILYQDISVGLYNFEFRNGYSTWFVCRRTLNHQITPVLEQSFG